MTYRKEIDGLRAVAVLSVIFYHSNLYGFKAGFIGVDVFFVISGYLISSLILKELEEGTFSLVRFYERRVRRILPALFLVMLCCIPFAWRWLMPLEFTMFAKSLVAVCIFSSNFLFWKETGYFEPANELKPLLHTWSLAVEEQFYLIFPLLFLFAWKWKRKGLLALVITASAFSIGVMQWGTLNSPDANYYLLPGRAWEFLLGMLITLYIHPIQKKTGALSPWFSQITAFLGMAMLIISLFTFNRYESFPSLYAFIPLLGTTLIILFATPTTLIGRLLCAPPLVGIGLISYSGYLWHQPLFAFARHASLREPEPWFFVTLIVFNFVLSYFSWKFVEQPFRAKNLFKQKQIFALSACCTVLLIGCGLTGIYNNGFVSRFGKQFLAFQEISTQSNMDGKGSFGERRPFFNPNRSLRLLDFVSNWKKDVSSPTHLRFFPLAMFGSSLGDDIHRGLQREGVNPIGMFGSGCSINPNRMNSACRILADTLFNYVKEHKEISHLALITRTYGPSELSVSFFEEVLSFWMPLNVKLIIFSQKPEFEFFKETLAKKRYPKPNFEFSDLSLRKEIKDYLLSHGVHLVNAKEIFCKITDGECDFKMGPRASFKAEDFLYYDGHHLTDIGQKEFSRILMESDPVFKSLAEEAKK